MTNQKYGQNPPGATSTPQTAENAPKSPPLADNRPTAQLSVSLTVSTLSGLYVSPADELYQALTDYKERKLKSMVSSLLYDLKEQGDFTESAYEWHTIEAIEDMQRQLFEKMCDLTESNFDAALRLESKEKTLEEKAGLLVSDFKKHFGIKEQKEKAGHE